MFCKPTLYTDEVYFLSLDVAFRCANSKHYILGSCEQNVIWAFSKTSRLKNKYLSWPPIMWKSHRLLMTFEVYEKAKNQDVGVMNSFQTLIA